MDLNIASMLSPNSLNIFSGEIPPRSARGKFVKPRMQLSGETKVFAFCGLYLTPLRPRNENGAKSCRFGLPFTLKLFLNRHQMKAI